MVDESGVRQRFGLLAVHLDERAKRLWAGAEAISLGYGGTEAVVRGTGIAASTVRRGIVELRGGEMLEGRVRQPGAGRKQIADTDAGVLEDLDRLADDGERGDPERPLRWCSKSHVKLADALGALGHEVSARTVAKLLRSAGWSLQANAKTREGSRHPDRDAQFRYINEQISATMAGGDAVVSVDTKKKELVGDFKNGGRELRPKGQPARVRTHDFIDKELGKVAPYGVYDLKHDEGFVSVGISHDTAQFSVASILAWWQQLGVKRFSNATGLLITADCGGSNSYRTRLWKVELQNLADQINVPVSVCHFPPGTSKWNKVEHRLFSYISMNWRGKPLISHQVILSLIAASKTGSGHPVHVRLDDSEYVKGIKVSDEQLRAINFQGHQFHPEWNYTISPSVSPAVSETSREPALTPA